MPIQVFLFILLLIGLITATSMAQSPWQAFPGARLIPSDGGDGDSFLVEIAREGEKEQHLVRLYYVDAPEASSGSDPDRRRVLEQMRYHGVESPEQVLEAGHAATLLTNRLLEEPFTLHTAFATAPGRSRIPRIYAAVTTSTGKDLAAELVKAGLARNKGMSRAMPDGTPASEYSQLLADLEASAMLGRKGIWKFADPDRLPDMRAEERQELVRLRQLFDQGEGDPVDLNTASSEELQRLQGLGPVLASRIIQGRPYTTEEELLNIQGVSINLLERWRNQLKVE